MIGPFISEEQYTDRFAKQIAEYTEKNGLHFFTTKEHTVRAAATAATPVRDGKGNTKGERPYTDRFA
jgi:hypothetical protein